MEMIQSAHYLYRGVSFCISDEAIIAAQQCEGIDVLRLAANAVDRMLKVKGDEKSSFRINMNIHNPHCDEDECIFEIRIYAVPPVSTLRSKAAEIELEG